MFSLLYILFSGGFGYLAGYIENFYSHGSAFILFPDSFWYKPEQLSTAGTIAKKTYKATSDLSAEVARLDTTGCNNLNPDSHHLCVQAVQAGQNNSSTSDNTPSAGAAADNTNA